MLNKRDQIASKNSKAQETNHLTNEPIIKQSKTGNKQNEPSDYNQYDFHFILGYH
ncbi:hypothetical protein tinsulaeT_22770 [Thalassotalea insulae]|uniref:Uncharacterized protein n=1 Tax=Thalassotalea insulae TaxID=2056778 RepID=A0ABQ6GUB5_9GAMM|nr:hypothetical protein [Thalassotalea insulae]GLX78937.1 hypothetical protein tinsulaeT_22770 [Thalassotalea insulae]